MLLWQENTHFVSTEFKKGVNLCKSLVWETDFYTPQVLGVAALLEHSAPAVYKITRYTTTLNPKAGPGLQR